MSRVDYDNQRVFGNFHRGRAHDESVMQLWRDTLRRLIAGQAHSTILDLGSGTGRFSSLWADEFDAQVIGVEPSDKMRQTAESEHHHPNVRFLKGSAEHIPLDADSCDVAWLSQISHHLPDLGAAASELRRVIRPSGRVVIRNNFQGRLDGFCRYYEFFPSGLGVDEPRHPSINDMEEAFRQQGFQLVAVETVEQMEASSMKEYAERIGLRTYSTFELISDEEYNAGLASVQAAAADEKQPQPVMAKIDLLVFELPQQ